MTLKKKLTMAVALVLIIALAIAGTYAYLTSTPDKVTNTFTIGKLAITLDELEVDEYGVAADNATRSNAGNEYKLMPGHNYKKDPTIHVQPGSEKCYLFVKVEDGLANIEADTKIADQITGNGWTLVTGETNVYWKAQDAVAADATDPVDVLVFSDFTLTTDAIADTYANAKIDITAYAIQQDGFDSAAAAWTASGWATSNG